MTWKGVYQAEAKSQNNEFRNTNFLIEKTFLTLSKYQKWYWSRASEGYMVEYGHQSKSLHFHPAY